MFGVDRLREKDLGLGARKVGVDTARPDDGCLRIGFRAARRNRGCGNRRSRTAPESEAAQNGARRAEKFFARGVHCASPEKMLSRGSERAPGVHCRSTLLDRPAHVFDGQVRCTCPRVRERVCARSYPHDRCGKCGFLPEMLGTFGVLRRPPSKRNRPQAENRHAAPSLFPSPARAAKRHAKEHTLCFHLNPPKSSPDFRRIPCLLCRAQTVVRSIPAP